MISSSNVSVLQPNYYGSPIVKVACGADFSMILDCKGVIHSFGSQEYSQLGEGICFLNEFLFVIGVFWTKQFIYIWLEHWQKIRHASAQSRFSCISLSLSPLSIYLSITISISLSIYLSLSLSIYMSLSLFLSLSLSLSIYMSLSLSLHLSPFLPPSSLSLLYIPWILPPKRQYIQVLYGSLLDILHIYMNFWFSARSKPRDHFPSFGAFTCIQVTTQMVSTVWPPASFHQNACPLPRRSHVS